MSQKSLLLLPTPLYPGHDDVPAMTLEAFKRTEVFITERARTLRRFLSQIQHPKPIHELEIHELDKHEPEQILAYLPNIFKLHPLVAFSSEAGTPCIADPGFRIVEWAHKNGVTVTPYPGPNSLVLALMASGFSGQTFRFWGYLSAKKETLGKDLRQLEAESKRTKSPQIFIEAPYRNRQILEAAGRHLDANTKLHVSLDLCTKESQSITLPVRDWKKQKVDLHKRPAVFVLQGF